MFVLWVTCKNFFGSYIKNWSKSRTCKSLGKPFCLPIFKILNFNNNNLDGCFKSFNYQLIKKKQTPKRFHFFLTPTQSQKVKIKMLWAVCFPVIVLSLLPTVPLPSGSGCSHCHSSSCQMFEWDPSYKKDTIIQRLYEHTYLYSPDSQQ